MLHDDHVHVVLDEQHRHPVVPQIGDVTEQRLGERRVHARHGLVEHDDRRVRTISARAISSSLRWPPDNVPAYSSRMWIHLEALE
jgi:hypothetical protein